MIIALPICFGSLTLAAYSYKNSGYFHCKAIIWGWLSEQCGIGSNFGRYLMLKGFILMKLKIRTRQSAIDKGYAMTETVKLIYEDQEYQLPLIVGTEGEKAVDISKLRQQSGLITLDTGYANTGSCTSAITFMDGEKGILRYRGIPVEQLAENSSFKETSYLLINGRLPTQHELTEFSVLLNDNSLVHEDMRAFYENFPRSSHPMGILSSMVNALRSFYPHNNILCIMTVMWCTT